jgi:hypothetical protein
MIDMSDMKKLEKALTATVQNEKVIRKAALVTHTEVTKRIFPARGSSKDVQNRSLGRYSKATREIRRKKGLFGAGISLQFTGQLEKAWGLKEVTSEWVSAFFIQGRRDSSQSNDEIADELEDRLTTYGKIFALSKEEEKYYMRMLEKYQNKLLNR